MKILLLSAYDAASHQRWRQDLEQHFPHFQWVQLSLPPRYFNWRVRGNSLTWAFTQRERLTGAYDLLIATSMVDLSALRGFVPSLGKIPTLVYFHENQFSYPANEDQYTSVEPQILSLYTALCADKLIFNSCFNRTTFMAGAEKLLNRLPDHVPADLIQSLTARSEILPVPLSASIIKPKKASQLTLIWNHRWEYDKGPERLLAMLETFFNNSTYHDKSPFILHVVGQQFRQQPAAFAEIKRLLEQHQALGEWGYCENVVEYQALLNNSHIVLSTALHDFQGLSVLEAVAAGCLPLVPARQAYPEWFGKELCYTSDLEKPGIEAEAMANSLSALVQTFAQGHLPQAPDISRLSWPNLLASYEKLFQVLVKNPHQHF